MKSKNFLKNIFYITILNLLLAFPAFYYVFILDVFFIDVGGLSMNYFNKIPIITSIVIFHMIPILIYNVVPWCYLSPDLLLRIMDEVPGVLGVKQSAGDMKLFADLIRRANPKNMIFSAVDALLYLSYKLGAPGSIAAILTAAPGPSVKLWDAVIDQDWETAKDLHEKLMPLWDAIGLDNMPSLCKYAQSLQGLESGFARRPTSPATDDQKEKVKEALINLNLIK